MNKLNRSVLTGIMVLTFVTTASASKPSVEDLAPRDGANPVDTLSSQLDDQSVELRVNAVDSEGENVNVIFYTENEALGEDTSPGPGYSFSWDVDQFGTYSWYAEAVDSNGDTTTSEVRSFQVTNSDDRPPSVTFESTPDSPTTDRNPTIKVSTDERAELEYSVDGRDFTDVGGGSGQDFEFNVGSLNNGYHTVEVRAEDGAGNTRTNSFNFKVADGSEVNFDLGADRSYPGSGIPIEPRSNVFGVGTDVDFEFSLVDANEDSIDISDGIGDGTCDFRGNEGWLFENNNYCGTKVPESTDVREYELVAEWDLRGQNHRKILASDFQIKETQTWYADQQTSHGGRIQEGSPQPSTSIKGNSAQQKYACKGSSFEIDSIDMVTPQCSNGVVGGDSNPPVVSFVRTPDGDVETSNNRMFNDPDCSINVNRPTLLNNDVKSHQGYYPEGCGISWSLGGEDSFTAITFDEPGEYEVFLDYINAVSDSPQYICPADPGSSLCDRGRLSGEPGWKNIESQTVNIIEPSVEVIGFGFSENSNVTNVDGDTYIRRPGYDGSLTGSISVKNNGTGNVNITGLDFECPRDEEDDQNVCEVITTTDLKIPDDSDSNSAVIDWKADIPDRRTTTTLNVTVQYEDSYGVGCPTTRTAERTYYLDEADPQTEDQVIN